MYSHNAHWWMYVFTHFCYVFVVVVFIVAGERCKIQCI